MSTTATKPPGHGHGSMGGVCPVIHAPVTSAEPVKAAPAVKANAPPAGWKSVVAGTCGGVFGLSICYPLDTVKVRFQTRPAGTYNGIWHCISTIAKTEGVAALYRGLTSPVFGYGLINGAAFGTNTFVKHEFKQNAIWNQRASYVPADMNRALTMPEMVISGAVAGAVQSFVRTPIEQIKVVMQSRNKPGTTLAPYSGSMACLVDVLKTEGVRVGLYRGLSGTLVREVPQYAMYYPIFEICKRLFTPKDHDPNDMSAAHAFRVAVAGGLAGVGQWLPTYPLDVVKSRLHAAEPGQYKGVFDCARKTLAAEGPSAFYRGLSASLFRAFPLHGLVFLGFETTMSLFNKFDI